MQPIFETFSGISSIQVASLAFRFWMVVMTCCLPVVAARLNPDIELPYDDIDLQHALSAT